VFFLLDRITDVLGPPPHRQRTKEKIGTAVPTRVHNNPPLTRASTGGAEMPYVHHNTPVPSRIPAAKGVKPKGEEEKSVVCLCLGK
jgi:hypothetical protein